MNEFDLKQPFTVFLLKHLFSFHFQGKAGRLRDRGLLSGAGLRDRNPGYFFAASKKSVILLMKEKGLEKQGSDLKGLKEKSKKD